MKPKWVKLSHQFHRNPKVMELAHTKHVRAIAVYACALSWCGENMTDGWIPDHALGAIFGTKADADALTALGLWVSDKGGWWVHDWEDWQDTNAKRQERTEYMRGLANIKHHGHPAGPGPSVTDINRRRPKDA